MNDDELRLLIRQAVERHLGEGHEPVSTKLARNVASDVGAPLSISFAQYQLERAPDDNMCLIEPAVRCNHCGFCKCHGH